MLDSCKHNQPAVEEFAPVKNFRGLMNNEEINLLAEIRRFLKVEGLYAEIAFLRNTIGRT